MAKYLQYTITRNGEEISGTEILYLFGEFPSDVAMLNTLEGIVYCHVCNEYFDLFINEVSEKFHNAHEYMFTINKYDIYKCREHEGGH